MTLGGFLILVMVERRAGVRMLASWRRALDVRARRAAFILAHVDWAAFSQHLVRTAIERVLHDTAHSILRLVRTIERILTRAVKRLRERRGLTEFPEEDESKPSRVPVVTRAWQRTMRTVRTAARRTRR